MSNKSGKTLKNQENVWKLKKCHRIFKITQNYSKTSKKGIQSTSNRKFLKNTHSFPKKFKTALKSEFTINLLIKNDSANFHNDEYEIQRWTWKIDLCIDFQKWEIFPTEMTEVYQKKTK